MKDTTPEQGLLPSGFEDLLPPQAEEEYRAIGSLLQVFAGYGYERVKPPLAEFESALLSGHMGQALSQDTFRVMDPVSHRMLGLRSDITAQIARIATARFSTTAYPLRLTYANDVIRTRASQERTLRQFTQVGCEIIGPDTIQADIEIAVVALHGLSALALRPVSLDFSLPTLVEAIFTTYSLTEADRKTVCAVLKSRDIAGLAALHHTEAQQLFTTLLCLSGPADPALAVLKTLSLPAPELTALVNRLIAVVEGVQTAMTALGFSDMTLTLDPLETQGFEYHDGVTFTFYAQGVRSEIGRGGRYLFPEATHHNTKACGFTFYMDSLRQSLPPSMPPKTIFVPQSEGWETIQKLQTDGWRVIRSTGENSPPALCRFIYENGNILEN